MEMRSDHMKHMSIMYLLCLFQIMQTIKRQLRLDMLSRIEELLSEETSLLIQHWTGPECQNAFSKYKLGGK